MIFSAGLLLEVGEGHEEGRGGKFLWVL